jgi:radical SAM protein (TIGR01212 family)
LSIKTDFSDWGDHRYFPISQFYKNRFGEKVYKVSVSIAESCPNRQPNSRMPLCIFCDEWGSAAYHLERDKTLKEQIIINRDKIARRYKANKFLVYFQSYTNTFDRVTELQERFEIALAEDNIEGIVLGTRPDCLPARILPLLKKTHESHYVMVELGLQSFFDHHLTFLQRGQALIPVYILCLVYPMKPMMKLFRQHRSSMNSLFPMLNYIICIS